MNVTFKNQNGFSVIELLIVLVILAVISVAGYVVYKKRHDTTAPVGTVITNWGTYTDKAGNYSVLSPISPSLAIVSPPVTRVENGASFEMGIVTFSAEGGEYNVVSTTWQNSNQVPSQSAFLKQLAHPKSSKYLADVHLISSQHTSVNGHEAESYQMTATAQNITAGGRTLPSFKEYTTGEFVRDGNTYYEVFANLGSNSANYQTNALHFVQSFALKH